MSKTKQKQKLKKLLKPWNDAVEQGQKRGWLPSDIPLPLPPNQKLNKEIHNLDTCTGDLCDCLNPQNLNNEKWEERFDKEFGRGGFGDTKIFIQIKSFISKLLAIEKEKLVHLENFYQKRLKQEHYLIREEVLEIIDKHDPNVGLERKTSKHFWGNTLREEIKGHIEELKNK